MKIMMPRNSRVSEYPIDPLFLNRWSPRAMSGARLSQEDLMTLFEAARWAPSSSNEQPWRFLYAHRESPSWPLFFDLLNPGNQVWCQNASMLVVVISHKVFERNGKPSRTHDFDAGSAWMSLALQGSLKGLVVHGMAGLDYDKARAVLGVPEDYDVEMMIAIGHPAPPETLPEKLQVNEKPNGRKKLNEIVFEGGWPKI